MKSSVDEIRQRFDHDVERFANLETGQSATIDAPLALELVAAAASAATPDGVRALDIGCGAGNFSLRLLQEKELRELTLIDLSLPMLERARERIESVSSCSVVTLQGDIRQTKLAMGRFDIILAGAVLHHLRSDAEWESTLANLYQSLAVGGSVWIFDIVSHPQRAVQALMWQRYGKYLASIRDADYRDHVFDYIDREDSPRPLMYQLELLRKVGFCGVDILHFNTCFAAFGAVKE